MAALPFMLPLAMAATAAGGVVSAMGTIAAGDAAADAGRRSQQAQEFRAKQEDMAANESRAAAQRAALEKQREGVLLGSKLQARAAAQGGGADDPTIVTLGEDIAGRSEYAALTDIYKGENRARGLEDQAIGDRYTGQSLVAEGEAKQRASKLSALGTIIGAAGSMARMGSGNLPAYG